ncbi:MAG: hypothetical protein ABUL60_01450 [Myxococcales bacterium]
MSEYDEAVATLYQAPLSEFVAERKRLAGELKAAGHKDAAARFGKLVRPPVSAWVVNQLWWREQDAFQALLAAAARVKAGDREASQAHRQALGQLRDVAAELLRESGNAASEPTLRRVTTTLSAVAASGGFEPDPAGALSADRDPPGFETLGFGAASSAPAVKREHGAAPPHADEDRRRLAKEAEAERAAEVERRRAEEAERQRRRAERERLSALLREATAVRDTQQRELSRLRRETEAAEQSLKESQALLADLEQKLASL